MTPKGYEGMILRQAKQIKNFKKNINKIVEATHQEAFDKWVEKNFDLIRFGDHTVLVEKKFNNTILDRYKEVAIDRLLKKFKSEMMDTPIYDERTGNDI